MMNVYALPTQAETIFPAIMTDSPDVHVRLDDRVRLMAAVLAITTTTDEAHARRPHSAHTHARATRKHLAAYKAHPAVVALQGLLNQSAPYEAIFGYALRLKPPSYTLELSPRWSPPAWNEQLGDFMRTASLSQWWAEEQPTWEKSLNEAKRVLNGTQFHHFLKPFVGESSAQFVFMPNISYPAEHEIGVRVGDDLYCITPPRPAWGDSAPWPFDEEPAYVFRAALGQYARVLMNEQLARHQDKLDEAAQIELPVSEAVRAQHPEWRDQFLSLFVSGLVAIYLEDHVSPIEAKGYTLMESKYHGNAMLPGVVSVLRRYMTDAAGGKYGAFAEFLPLFPKQLRVARRIYSL